MEMGGYYYGLWVGLPKTRKLHDSIWVIVDRVTKSAHFILVKSTYRAEDYVKMYIDEILKCHGIHLSIVSDRGAQFTSHFFQKTLFTQVKLNTDFHPRQIYKESVPFIPLKT